ncbi:MAG: DNA polymerase, partial [Candidatus Aenigmarchaeota archaeon]|nr:DNA polymerase [Candidatus Aenigmarchaeota archaeon]
IISHNICPTTINCECCKNDGYISPEINGKRYVFCKKRRGFVSSVLEDLVFRRLRIKEILRDMDKDDKDYKILSARSYALKTIANSIYGYLGFPRSRWYCIECAASITAWGRYYIKKVIEEAKKNGFEIIYGDTDSIMIALGKKTQEDSKKFFNKINKELPGVMKLDFQGYYPRGIFVTKKIELEKGAKKKYALVDESGKLVIKGFEFVRRDWSKIAKKAQMEVFKAILIEGSKEKAISIIKNIINNLKEHKVPIEDVIIYTQLTRDIESYESIGPHVAAAKKATKLGYTFEPGQIIKYVVTKGEGSISERAYLLDEFEKKGMEYDPDYYIDHQVLPAVEKIFEVLGYSKDELKGKIQTKLNGFFK